MKRTFNTRTAPGFGLAFLDVLCCGLGSAVLLLLIVKHGPADADTVDQATIDAQTRGVNERIAATELHRDALLARLTEQESDLSRDTAALMSPVGPAAGPGGTDTPACSTNSARNAPASGENAANLQALQTAVGRTRRDRKPALWTAAYRHQHGG